MGLFTKHEKYNPESGKFEAVEKPKEPKEIKELTREEQFEVRRHPWQTERGKRVIKTLGSGVKRLDRAIVNYNRRHNPMRGQGNFNPWGTTFDKGNEPMKKPSQPKGGKKYIIRGGKAYPVAGTGKRKKKKKPKGRKGGDAFSFDFGSW